LGELTGILIVIVSSSLGGTAAAVSGRQCRSDHARHSARGYRLCGVAAGGTAAARQMAAVRRLAGVGLVAVFAGIWIATTQTTKA
jgi:hypothetical protein